MHSEALGGGVAEFDAAVEAQACPFLNELGAAALSEMRTVYEQVGAGNYEALGDLAERLATAVAERTVTPQSEKSIEQQVEAIPDEPAQVEAAVVKPLQSAPLPEPVPELQPATAPHEITPKSDRVVVSIETLATTPVIEAQAEASQPKTEVISVPEITPAEVVQLSEQAAVINAVEAVNPRVVSSLDVIGEIYVANETEENTVRPTTAELVADVSDFIKPEESMSDGEEPEALFEPETLEIYEELLAVIAGRETKERDLSEEALNLSEIDDITEVTTDFEIFMATQPEPEEPLTLQRIIEQADDQPLVETFVQLAQLLSYAEIPLPLESAETAREVSEAPEPSSEQATLRAVLQEIATALPAQHAEGSLEQPDIIITPELTENLLTLLRSVGYQEPGEILVAFVEQYGQDFLLQTLQYMCQLSYEDGSREVLPADAALLQSSDEDSLRLHLGKALLNLIAGQTFGYALRI